MKALLAATVILLFSTAATAGPIIQWQIAGGGNGHYYEFVDSSVTWPVAKTAAESMLFMGMQGHLATITSAGENSFIFGNVLAPSAFDGGAWIGLTDDEAFGGHESFGQPNPQVDGWRWVTGESVAFTAWNSFSAEPNNGVPNNSGDEDYGLIHVFRGNVWNDQTSFYAVPFIVEFEPAAVPEPSTMLAWSILGAVFCCGRFARRPIIAKME